MLLDVSNLEKRKTGTFTFTTAEKLKKLLNELRLVTQLATAVINSTVKRDNTEMWPE